MEKGGILHLRGVLPEPAGGLNFDVLLQLEDGDWRVFGIAVYRSA